MNDLFEAKLEAKAELEEVHQCDFCSSNFKTKEERKLHTIGHFHTKSCTNCNTFLIEISDDWYELHTDFTCNKENKNIANIEQDGDSLIIERQSNNSKHKEANDEIDKLKRLQSKLALEIIPLTTIFLKPEVDVQSNISISSGYSDQEGIRIVDVKNINENKQTIRDKRKKAIRPSKTKTTCKEKTQEKESEENKMVELRHSAKILCKICNKMLLNKATYLNHMQTVHNPDKKRSVTCDTCGRSFSSAGNLKNHKKLHMETKEFVCNYCGREFTQRDHLKDHINMHEGIKPYICKVCSKAFTRRPQLKSHNRVHTGEKPFKCPIVQCERAYAHQIDLKRHKYSAHGIYTKKHVCLICSKVYSENKLLQKHLNSHRGS